MKKKVVAIFLVVILCISVFSFVGCDRHSTLQLLDVWQSTDGRILLDIKGIDDPTQNSVQVSFDNGKTWKDTSIIEDINMFNEKYYYGAKVQESDYGTTCQIVVRLIKDESKRKTKKSNAIEYYIKKPCEYEIKSSDESVFEVEYDDNLDTYLFVYGENDNVILKKYYAEQDGIGEILPVKEQDRLDFEYKIYKSEDVTDDAIERAKELFGENAQDLELWSYLAYVFFDIFALECDTAKGFKDFDFQNGISKSECGEGIEDLDETIVWFAIRIKGNATTLCSGHTFIRVVLS